MISHDVMYLIPGGFAKEGQLPGDYEEHDTKRAEQLPTLMSETLSPYPTINLLSHDIRGSPSDGIHYDASAHAKIAHVVSDYILTSLLPQE